MSPCFVSLNTKLSDHAKHYDLEHGLNFSFFNSVLSTPKGKQTTRSRENGFPIPDSLVTTGLLKLGLRPRAEVHYWALNMKWTKRTTSIQPMKALTVLIYGTL